MTPTHMAPRNSPDPGNGDIIQTKEGHKGQVFGFKMDRYTSLDGATLIPKGMKENKDLASKIASLYKKRSVLAFTGAQETVVRLVGEKYYVALTLNNDILKKDNHLDIIKELYTAALLHIDKKNNTIKTTHVALSELDEDYESQTA